MPDMQLSPPRSTPVHKTPSTRDVVVSAHDQINESGSATSITSTRAWGMTKMSKLTRLIAKAVPKEM